MGDVLSCQAQGFSGDRDDDAEVLQYDFLLRRLR